MFVPKFKQVKRYQLIKQQLFYFINYCYNKFTKKILLLVYHNLFNISCLFFIIEIVITKLFNLY